MQNRALIQRIQSREAVVGIIGLGYVGLPLTLAFAQAGFRVVGFDIDQNKVDELLAGRSYIHHIPAKDIAACVNNGTFAPTTDYSQAAQCDAILLCVPTPLNRNREPDMSYIVKTGQAIAPHLQRGQIVILESTTYPGTTDEVLRAELEGPSKLVAGKDFHLAYSPEREDPGNPNFSTQRIPKLVGGLSPSCSEIALALYSSVLSKVIRVSSTRVAELSKLLENIFRGVNIALVNELKMLCDRMGIDVWEVIDAASTKPFGYMPFYPGPGLGGHCIPIDPFYLTWKAREFEFSTRFIELAGEINTAMPRYVVERLADALNKQRKAVSGSKVLLMGMAYKRDVDDLRESPTLHIIELLQERGADVTYHDPFIPKLHKTREYHFEMNSQALTQEFVGSQDAVVIVTDHSQIDYQWLVNQAALVVDTRNATRAVIENRQKIVKA